MSSIPRRPSRRTLLVIVVLLSLGCASPSGTSSDTSSVGASRHRRLTRRRERTVPRAAPRQGRSGGAQLHRRRCHRGRTIRQRRGVGWPAVAVLPRRRVRRSPTHRRRRNRGVRTRHRGWFLQRRRLRGGALLQGRDLRRPTGAGRGRRSCRRWRRDRLLAGSRCRHRALLDRRPRRSIPARNRLRGGRLDLRGGDDDRPRGVCRRARRRRRSRARSPTTSGTWMPPSSPAGSGRVPSTPSSPPPPRSPASCRPSP